MIPLKTRLDKQKILTKGWKEECKLLEERNKYIQDGDVEKVLAFLQSYWKPSTRLDYLCKMYEVKKCKR